MRSRESVILVRGSSRRPAPGPSLWRWDSNQVRPLRGQAIGTDLAEGVGLDPGRDQAGWRRRLQSGERGAEELALARVLRHDGELIGQVEV